MEDRVITQQLRKVGNSFVVTVPKEEVERRGWREGQLLAVQLTTLEVRPVLRRELQEIVEELLDEHEDALRYLAGR
jgi:antitoxin component of MazEF toxin-antitoxin module